MKLLVIAGATASGKASLALALARRLDGEIVSADSRKIYRGMNIGTAKPSAELQAEIPHHLLDCCDPGQRFSAARFVELADRAIADISGRGRLPIVSGGTGLYIRSLLYGIIETPPRDDALRQRLEALEAGKPGSLHQLLLARDPKSAARIPAGDKLRQVRALEVLELSGKPISSFQTEHGLRRQRYASLCLALEWDRRVLRNRIERRVDRMLAAGWLEEAKALLAAGKQGAAQVVGYRQLAAHLKGEMSLAEARQKIVTAHWRYAKQQLTWFKAQQDFRWWAAPVDVEQVAKAFEYEAV